MEIRMVEFPQVSVYIIHAAVNPAFADIKRVPDILITLLSLFTFPNFPYRAFIYVTVTEFLVLKIGAAAVQVATCHYICPEKRCCITFCIGTALLIQLAHRALSINHTEVGVVQGG